MVTHYSSTRSLFTFGLFFSLLFAGCGGGGGNQADRLTPALQIARGTLSSSALPVQVPRSADAFVDAIGVNMHLDYGDTAYVTAWSRVKTLLVSSGIRHIRDGLNDPGTSTYYAHLIALAAAGIHSNLITEPSKSPAFILAYPSHVPNSMESYEGPNEYDIGDAADPNWASELATFQKTLYNTVKGNAATSRYAVIAPALSSQESYVAVGDLSGSVTYGNLHLYYGGRNPGIAGWGDPGIFGGDYGSMEYNFGLARHMSGDKPIVVTETGYNDSLVYPGGVTPPIQARLTIRTLLEFWNAGILRTYLYEFLDEGGLGSNFGLLDASANPKPVYSAVKNLIAALTDIGTPFAMTPLSYALSGTPSIHQALFQKRNGSYVLAIWNEVPSWDLIALVALKVAPQPVSLSLNAVPSAIGAATFSDTGSLVPASIRTTSAPTYTFSINDHVTLVTITPPS
jgi:hypothetical protein